MKIRNFLMIGAIAIFASCGGTKEVQKTGTKEAKVTSATGSVSSTGKCKTFSNKKEEQTMLTKYSLYREPFKNKTYAEGMENWQYIIANFPGFRKTPFYDGIEMYKSKMEAADATAKEDLMRKVMSMYDGLAKCHGDAGEIARQKANEYLKWDKKFKSDNSAKVGKLYEESLAIEGNGVRNTVLKYLWGQYRKDFAAKTRTEAEVLAFGAKIKEIAKVNIANNTAPTSFEDLIASVDKGLYTKTTSSTKTDVSTCEGIEAYYTDKISDVKQATQARLRMDKLGCTGSFYQTVLAISPKPAKKAPVSGASSVFKEAIVLYKAKDYTGAANKMDAALAMNPAPALNEQISYYAGDARRAGKDYQGAARYYENVIASGSKYKAKAYIGLGNCYLGAYSKCGSSAKEKAGVAWVAADMYKMAMSDPESSAKASKMLATAQKYFLEKGDMFMAGIKDGDTVNVGCWINKSTTARGM